MNLSTKYPKKAPIAMKITESNDGNLTARVRDRTRAAHLVMKGLSKTCWSKQAKCSSPSTAHLPDVSFAAVSVPPWGQSRPRSEIAAWFPQTPIAWGRARDRDLIGIYLVLITRTTTYRVPVCSGAVLAWRASVDPAEEARMQWQTPKLVEIACGCEINAYFPAEL